MQKYFKANFVVRCKGQVVLLWEKVEHIGLGLVVLAVGVVSPCTILLLR